MRASVVLLLAAWATLAAAAGELCFCTYNLNLRVGDTITIRDYVHVCDDSAPVAWATAVFTYTAFGADDPTRPSDWHLADFNANLPVTVTATDATAAGNHGTVRISLYW